MDLHPEVLQDMGLHLHMDWQPVRVELQHRDLHLEVHLHMDWQQVQVLQHRDWVPDQL